MRLTVTLLTLAAIGVIAGAALIATWVVGLAVVADSVAVGAYALLRDVPTPVPSRPTVNMVAGSSFDEVLERARASR